MEFCSLRKLFKLICILLTLFLVCQELSTFAVIKPTSTSHEERQLDITDVPEVVVCLEPGFHANVLRNYGYQPDTYYRGSMNWDAKFVGWNGGKGETKSSHEILEEALTVKSEHLNETRFITRAAYYAENLNQFLLSEVQLRTLAHPFGRCFIINLPPTYERSMSDTVIFLVLKFNATVVENYKDVLIRMYFMDKTNSLKIYPDEHDIVGNPLKIRIAELLNKKSTYKTKISRSSHVQGDPLFKCNVYTVNNSYNDCIQNELLGSFHDILGCQPPLLADDPCRMCDEKFNISTANDTKIQLLFMDLSRHDVNFKCRKPCTTNKYSTRLLHTAPYPDTLILVSFDKTLEVTRSTFSINSPELQNVNSFTQSKTVKPNFTGNLQGFWHKIERN